MRFRRALFRSRGAPRSRGSPRTRFASRARTPSRSSSCSSPSRSSTTCRRWTRTSTWTCRRWRRRDGRTRAVIVLGIDPGTATTGYGVVSGDGSRPPVLVECGVIRTRPRDSLSDRLREIHEGVTELLVRHRPHALVVEDVFYAKNVRTTVVLGHARGVVLLAGAQARVEVHEYPPADIKKAVAGTGGATKEQVQFMLTRLLRLKAVPSPSDAADGVAAALTYLMTSREPKLAVARPLVPSPFVPKPAITGHRR